MIPSVRVFSTAPQSRDADSGGYPRRVADAARWSEAAGCEGLLIYTDNGIADPWLVAQLTIQATERLCPLIAVQPAYMHPYTVAKLAATIALLHDRRTYLNLVAGGFRNDLLALGDETAHDQRYERLVEYGELIKALAAGDGPVSMTGRYYSVHNLRLVPELPATLEPGLIVSGSSAAGMDAARRLGALAITYPGPTDAETPRGPQHNGGLRAGQLGLRVGVIAREDREEAWRVAHDRFPPDRAGQIAHTLAMRTSDSDWHRQLSALAQQAGRGETVYWLHPFENYETFCPYLVGDYSGVATELRRYLQRGFDTFILDIPPSEDELHHTAVAFREAGRGLAADRDGPGQG